ncbi:MAG: translation initiation factor IF-2 [Bacteroidia bacterium]|nr:translation initiation factor IF-2 [Bacteroidia bacterium]
MKEQEKTTEVNTLARKLDSELEDSPVKKNEFSDVLSVSEKVKEQIQPTESIFTTEVTTLEKTDTTSIPIQEESSTKVEEKNSLTSEAQEVAPSIQQDTSSTPKDFVIRAKDHAPKLQGLTIKGKIELPPPKPKKSHSLATKESTKIKEKETTKETARESIQGAAAIAGAKITSKTQETTPSQEIPEISIAVEKIELPAESLPTVKIEATEVSPTTASEASVAAPQEKELGEKKRRRKRKRKRKSSSETSALQNTPSLQSTSSTKVAPGTSTKKPALGKNKLQGIPATKPKEEISSREIQEKIKSTLAEMHKTASRKRQITRKEKRNKKASILEQQELEKIASSNVLEVTEFLTANELATLMNVSVNEVIKKCMELGLFVSINQRIDADVISLIAEEFGYQVKFISIEESFYQETKTVNEAELQERHPIVTVMGHVDHGKTSLLDYIRRTNVIAGEAGGITQHIGAYEVTLDNGKKITFLDTPGHEAFTAMRARGAQITDIAIIVIAADDQVMPQTKEAIHHAQAAGVPMVFAINKIDKPGANPEKIKEQLAQMNILVEEWGGKYQCQEISAKYGKNVNELLEKVLLEAELLELKANPNAPGRGTILEAQLDKGRGVVATILVQDGTCKVGDIMLANTTYGRIKAMFDERNRKVKSAGPSTPVQVLGLDGLPQAGDKFQIMESEKEARALAAKRQQLLREQSLRMQKRVTLEEISRRSAHGGKFKELNLIVKGDVDGSVEALSDSLIKLSTEEVAVKIIMKGVGQISESDVLLASASDAIIVGFQVRPSPGARKLAQQEAIDIRLYSVIYDAINEIKGALEGMLAPTIIEEVTGVAEVRELFKISKIGTVAGCLVSDGKITRGASVRLIREGIVIYTGKIASLKRFKEDAKEVTSGFECGISIENFNDLKVGDIIEAFTQTEVKRNLSS